LGSTSTASSETNAAVDQIFGYTGRALDESTGQQNNLNRWYDPKLGIWISEDPIGFDGDPTNVYRYVSNSPLLNTDPTGLIQGIFNVIDEANRRRGNGPWDDSAQHCWAACYIAARFGDFGLSALIADIAEILAPSGDWLRDIAAQHLGAALGSAMRLNNTVDACVNTGQKCDAACLTWPK